GSTPGAANVISGNSQDGILISGALLAAFGSKSNQVQVQGNLIGTDVTGNFALPNAGNGVQIAAGANGNTIGGDSSDAGNVISGNGGEGVLISGTGTKNNQVIGNFIGTDPSGTFAVGNSDGVGIAAGASNNTVGGAADGAGNVISGNTNNGVVVIGTGTTNNQIMGNFVGTDVTGTFAVANLRAGVGVSFGAKNNIIGGAGAGAGNVISGNGNDGVVLSAPGTTGNHVQGNFIGTDISGTFALANGNSGVDILLGANANTIGGTAALAGNVISGNILEGIFISNADATLVQGNFIGTDVTGSIAVPNAFSGVFLGVAHNTTIAGTGARNVISGNAGDGVTTSGANPTTNIIWTDVVQGNFIGTDVSGTLPLGNAGNGVLINGKASRNTIGGTVRGAPAPNIIAFNGLAGVLVDSGVQNTISRNSIFSNAGLGIDLNAANNANNSQSAPLLKSAALNAAGTAIAIKGTLTSTANTTFTLQFFASPPGDP